MKILHVTNHVYPCIGGIERYVEELCLDLIERGHECEVVCLDRCSNKREKLPEFEEYKGIRIHRIPFLDLRIYKLAPRILKFTRDCDVIHIHGLGFFSDFLTLTSFFHRKPLLLSTVGGVFHTPAHSSLKHFYFNVWCRLVLRKISAVLAVSKNDEKIFSKVVDRITYVPIGIKFKNFIPGERGEANTLLYVGRISKNKRIDNLINMIYFLEKRVPEITLRIVGEDWEGIKNGLEKMIEELGLKENVIFVGRVDNERLLEYYSRAKIFLSASEFESFGLTALEAMASGMTVVLNDIPAFREFVKDGENGFILDFSNSEEAAIKVANILDTDLSDIRITARETAKEYDWRTVGEKIMDVYIKVREGRN